MLTDVEPRQLDGEADRLREAIRRHRRKSRPSNWSERDCELYRSLTPDVERPILHVVPPDSYAEMAERYYDSPY